MCSAHQQKVECFYCFPLWTKHVEILSRNVKWNNTKALCISFNCYLFQRLNYHHYLLCTGELTEEYNSGFLKLSCPLLNRTHNLCWYIFHIYKDLTMASLYVPIYRWLPWQCKSVAPKQVTHVEKECKLSVSYAQLSPDCPGLMVK